MTTDLRPRPSIDATGRLDDVVARLAEVESEDAPILSVYLRLDPKHNDWKSIGPRLKNLLDPVVELARSGEMSHVSAMELRWAVDEVLATSESLERAPSKGMAFFYGPGIELRERVELPSGLWDCAVVGPAPYMRPLRALLDGFHRIAAVLVDPRRTEVFTFRSGELIDRELFEADALRKTNLAGWYGLDELRNRQHGEEVRNHLFREVAERLDHMRRDQGTDLVLVGGQHEVTAAFLPFLQTRVREMTETFVVDLHTLTPQILTERVFALERSFEEREEKAEVDEVYTAAAEGGLGAIGVGTVLVAGSHHAISRLLIHDGVTRTGAVCRSCGALSGPIDVCVVCRGETRQVSDVFEELVRAVVEAGGTVEHVMSDTRLADDLVAARLRFKA